MSIHLVALLCLTTLLQESNSSSNGDVRRDLACVLDLAIPPYGPIGQRTRKGGTVVARIFVGKQGKADSVQLKSTNELLAPEVRLYLEELTKYAPECSGSTVELIFIYEIEGEAPGEPISVIRFLSPNRFLIKSQAKAPSIFIVPEQKKGRDAKENPDAGR